MSFFSLIIYSMHRFKLGKTNHTHKIQSTCHMKEEPAIFLYSTKIQAGIGIVMNGKKVIDCVM